LLIYKQLSIGKSKVIFFVVQETFEQDELRKMEFLYHKNEPFTSIHPNRIGHISLFIKEGIVT
jgi:hypothetical protein